MRTGDDHHGHHALDGEFVGLAGEQPKAQRTEAGPCS
jgi:hypothetical protein